MHLLLELSLACSIIAGCSTQTQRPTICLSCRWCYYMGQVYEHGSQFQYQCNTCWCTNGSVRCRPIDSGFCRVKPGTCPRTMPGRGICLESCRSDDDCPGAQKCCFNGCGHVCT